MMNVLRGRLRLLRGADISGGRDPDKKDEKGRARRDPELSPRASGKSRASARRP